ncbi:MAG: tetratricopeptide repeat protein [Brevinema sp.]
MKNNIFSILLIFFLSSCTSGMKFERLFSQQEYVKAYEVLRKNPKPNSAKYQSQELKGVIALVVNGHNEYIPVLEAILPKSYPEKNQQWVSFGRAWMRFMSAEKEEEFAGVLDILPAKKFSDPSIELLRLSIQSHALLKLDRYQEMLMHLDDSPLTPNSSDLLYLKGLAQLKLDNLFQAERLFKKSISVTKNEKLQALGYFYLGEISERKNNEEKAFEYYTISWELEPYNAETNFRIGTLLQKRSTESLHTRFYKTALRLNDNLANAWFSLNIQ